MNIRNLTLAFAAALAVAAPAAWPQTAGKTAQSATAVSPASPAPTPEIAAIRTLIEQRVPGMEVRAITRTEIAGLYEVLADDRIVYVDPKVNFLFMGSIYDLSSKQNLTDERYRALNRIAFDSLPFAQSFKRVRGDGSRRIAMFSDAD